MKMNSRRRRSKLQIQEEKDQAILRQQDIDAKLASYETMNAQLQKLS